jgi:hypothetical protein
VTAPDAGTARVSAALAELRAALAAAGGDARLMPTGTCYCGCGGATTVGAFFLPGHDKRAEAAVLAARYGNQVVRLLAAHGFGPDRSVVDAAVADGGWTACPGCGTYKGAPASIAAHQRRGCPGPGESPQASQAIVDANLSRMRSEVPATPEPDLAPDPDPDLRTGRGWMRDDPEY